MRCCYCNAPLTKGQHRPEYVKMGFLYYANHNVYDWICPCNPSKALLKINSGYNPHVYMGFKDYINLL